MYFALNDDQTALREGVRNLLTGECTPEVVRGAWADPAAGAAALWAQLAEMGLPGAAVPEAQGGLGLGACDIVPLLEEAGRVAAPIPLVETAFVAAPLFAAAGLETELELLLEGKLLVACALDGSPLVPYGQFADRTLISSDAGAGRSIRMLDAAAAAAAGSAVNSVDATRAVLSLTGDRPEGIRLDLSPAQATAAWQRGVLGSAAELVGLARTLLAQTTAYVKDRRQFGVPVGSFQAIKHHLADALIAVEFAAPAVMRAAWSLDQGSSSRDRDVAMAKALASDAAERVAAIAVQCHGAIAYTTEYDLHLYAKRVWAGSRCWGSAEWQRRRVAVALGL
jgi:alkylation response protein AidB-like acyl-CoA dehydrogenase